MPLRLLHVGYSRAGQYFSGESLTLFWAITNSTLVHLGGFLLECHRPKVKVREALPFISLCFYLFCKRHADSKKALGEVSSSWRTGVGGRGGKTLMVAIAMPEARKSWDHVKVIRPN